MTTDRKQIKITAFSKSGCLLSKVEHRTDKSRKSVMNYLKDPKMCRMYQTYGRPRAFSERYERGGGTTH